jgi:hypothetical protein
MFRSFIKNPFFTLVLTVSSTVLIAPAPPPGGTRPLMPVLPRPGGGGGQPGLTPPPLSAPGMIGGAPNVGRPPGVIGTPPMIVPPQGSPASCPVAKTSYNGTECSDLGCTSSWICGPGYALPPALSAPVTSTCNPSGTCSQPAGTPPKCIKNPDSIFNDPSPSSAPDIPATWKGGGYCAAKPCALTVVCSGGCVPSQSQPTLQGRCQSTTNCVANGGIGTLPQCVRRP